MTRIPDPDENRETRWPESDAGPPDFDSDEWHEDEFGNSLRPYDHSEDDRIIAPSYCEDFPCCGHEAGDCDGSLYGSDEAIKRRVYERGYDEMEDEKW